MDLMRWCMLSLAALISAAAVPSSTFADAGGTAATTPAPLDPKKAEAVQAFVVAHRDSPEWGPHRGADGQCVVDRKAHAVHLAFSADGQLACKITQIPEGYAVRVRVLVPEPFRELYTVEVEKGPEPSSRLLVRGTWQTIKDAVSAVGLAMAPPLPAASWVEVDFGPFRNDEITIRIRFDEAGVSWGTTLTVSHLYQVNLALMVAAGPGTASFAVQNGLINASSDAPEPDYYVGCELYPLSWQRSNGRIVNGRYFDGLRPRFQDRITVIGAVSLTEPTERVYLGVGFEVYEGIAVTGGWQPRKEQVLQADFALGQRIEGSSVPIDREWNYRNWAVGVAIDAVAVKHVIEKFK